MSRKASLSDDDKREIVAKYADGTTWVALAREYHCRFYLIKSILQDAGVVPRQSLTANTPIECRLHDALMAAGIGFTTQRRLVGRYVVDISIHQAPVVIEADGARHRAGSAAQQRDAARDAAHEAAGYRVFRFTGSEINTDAGKCIQQVIDACGLTPDEEPVYNIRTKFGGPDHPRWKGLYTLVCEYCGNEFQNKRARRRFCCQEHFILHEVKGKPKSEEHRARIGAAGTGRKHTAEAKAKISAARMGTPSPNKGKSPSPETRAKISASLKGNRDSAETRARKSAARRGKKHSAETRAKISAAVAARKRQDQIKI